ncbi:MFS transporter [Halovivax gelatinilyticus]|uniref:MFS transporter n=1 Tax=Halovivax gelatinilyticus TaxID=2961597 RepID=UPI0020CA2CB8|nr:MFS transporter [Halovivax gelatinilyticus]
MNTPGGRISPRTGVFGSLCVLVFLVNFARIIYAPLLEPFRTTFGVSAGAVGLLATLVWIGSAAPRFPTGYLLTKYPRHRVVLASGLVLAGSSLLAASAPTFRLLAGATVLVGVGSGIYFVAASPLIGQLYPGQVGRAIGIHGTASQLAAVVAPGVVGAVLAVTLWPFAPWRALFVLLGIAALGSSILFSIAARRSAATTTGSLDLDLRTAIRSQWRLILAGIAVVGLAGMVWNGVFNFYVTYLVEAKGLSETRARTALTVVFATGVPAFWFAGVLADRLPFVPLLLAILFGFVLALGGLVAVGGYLAILAVSAALGFVIHCLFPVTDTYILASLPETYRGSGYAAFSGTMMPIQAVGSVFVGLLVDAGITFDAVFVWMAIATGSLTAVLTILALVGRFPSGVNR